MKNKKIISAGIVLIFCNGLSAVDCSLAKNSSRGMYFSKKQYVPNDFPNYQDIKDLLPEVILTSDKELIDMYWFCWKTYFTKLKKPQKTSNFVSNFIDEAFSPQIFQWDTIFMTMFARYAHGIFPAINSLDNFYINQYKSGYICRELREKDGSDFVYKGRYNTINPPLFSWSEVETYKTTGDKSRFKMVLPVLEKYVEWLELPGTMKDASGKNWEKNGRKAKDSVHHLYWNTPLGSGMDNTPIGEATMLVDMSCQMVMQYNDLAKICRELGYVEKAEKYEKLAKNIAKRINKYCWNEKEGFYYDVDKDGKQVKIKSIRAFWTMLAGVSSPEQNEKLVKHLKNPKEFWRKFIFPTLAADQKQFQGHGGYWLGGVWAPTNYAVIKGLEKAGYEDFATESSLKYVNAMLEVYKKTGTVWENYAPDFFEKGQPAKKDFVGWTGVGPIALVIENILGFRNDGAKGEVTWFVKRHDKHGIKRLQVGNALVDIVAMARATKSESLKFNAKASKATKLVVINNGKKKTFYLTSDIKTFEF